jgi:hypothetical protein
MRILFTVSWITKGLNMGHRFVVYFLLWGIIATIAFLPFLFGMMRPGFNGGNPYEVLITMFNFPVTFALGGVIDWLGEYLYNTPDPRQAVFAQFYVTVAFWSILGGGIGLVRDLNGNSGG